MEFLSNVIHIVNTGLHYETGNPIAFGSKEELEGILK
jgi:hypothetical protein